MASTFSESDKQTTGLYANDYLWSDLKNWSTGALPGSADAVTLTFGQSAPSVVNVTASVSSVTFITGGSLLVAGSLTTGSLIGLGGGITIGQGGVLEVTTLMSSFQAFTLNGGTLKLDASVALPSGSSFTFGATASYGTSTLYIADPANFNATNFFSIAVNAFDVGDSVQFGTMNFTTASYNKSNNTLSLVSSAGKNYTVNNFKVTLAGAPTFRLSTASNGGTILTLNCFLAGTRIETPDGPVAIETLSEGDLVVTVEHGAHVSRPVRWIGSRAVDMRHLDPDAARDAAPVRIRAHAFADNIPARDLLVTADHCIFESGCLIPARMLVNASSIVLDTERLDYRVYHLELENHSILLSEGLTTESYLDTGNRAGFGEPDTSPDPGASWTADAAAPLATGRTQVEPVWRRLAARAEALGMGAGDWNTAFSRPTTDDPALCLKLADGRLLRARRSRGNRHFFVLPAGNTQVILQSRHFVPADIEGPFVDDRRRLGVCVRAATLWTGLCGTLQVIGEEAAEADPRSGWPRSTWPRSGWHQQEHQADCRWTDGAGRLAWPALAQPTVLEIELAVPARYALDADRRELLRA